MNTLAKLSAILAAVQTDPGQRGLASDPSENLFTATAGDFVRACESLTAARDEHIAIYTGFFIPDGQPPAFETDGPLGALHLFRTLRELGYSASLHFENKSVVAEESAGQPLNPSDLAEVLTTKNMYIITIERGGPAADGQCYTMNGEVITNDLALLNRHLAGKHITIAIGDGGNEYGMGRISTEIVSKNIKMGRLIHCIVPADHLIVSGVSNWGAYALSAGLFILQNKQAAQHLFQPEFELKLLQKLVLEGPLVDGVTGQLSATVDGLTWEEYIHPLSAIRHILEQS